MKKRILSLVAITAVTIAFVACKNHLETMTEIPAHSPSPAATHAFPSPTP